MKTRTVFLSTRTLFFCLLLATAAQADTPWVALSWHDVRDEGVEDIDADPFAVGVERLAEQFDWLEQNGWTPVSIDRIMAAAEGRGTLPDKAVLLTFDDGLKSLYTHVFPLLKAYGYPAVAAVVTGWLESPGSVETGALVSWRQVREMADSGLVEIASHSHDLHRGVQANPQGNQQPAATTRQYLADPSRYETEQEWRRRVARDLETSADLIEAHTGRRPRVMVWPFGEYNAASEALARERGMTVSLGLTTGPNPAGRLHGLNRFLVTANPDIDFFANALPQAPSRTLHRAAHVDLDYVYDPDPAQQESNLDALIERIHGLNINTVYLQAFADPDGDGTAAALYFPNRHLPVREDLFSRVAWQLRTRAEVSVYAWMPVLSFDLPDRERARRLRVKRLTAEGPQAADFDYRRLSPFLPEARRIIRDIYADLAAHARFDGLLYHDDAYLSSHEDASGCTPDATWPGGSARDPCDPARKTRALIDFTQVLTDTVRVWRPAVKTARNLYACPVLNPDCEARFSQNLGAFLDAYDMTAIMAMPWMEGADDPEAWLLELVEAVRAHPQGLERSLFELQARDWAGDRWIDGDTLRDHMHLLIRHGAVNLGYYPDDFVTGQPDAEALFQGISIRTFPYRGYRQ